MGEGLHLIAFLRNLIYTYLTHSTCTVYVHVYLGQTHKRQIIGGREEQRNGGREWGRDGGEKGREGGREGVSEGVREGGREGGSERRRE